MDMHAYAAGLRRELTYYETHGKDARVGAVKSELDRVEALIAADPGAAAATDTGAAEQTAPANADRIATYRAALVDEKAGYERAGQKDRAKAVQDEIDRVDAALAAADEGDDAEPGQSDQPPPEPAAKKKNRKTKGR